MYPPAAPIPVVVFLSYANLLVFGGLVGAADCFRGRSEFHKRLMLLGTLNLLTAALRRSAGLHTVGLGLLTVFGLPDLFIVVCVAYDTLRHRRLHPGFAWGALLSIAWPLLAIWIGGSSLGQSHNLASQLRRAVDMLIKPQSKFAKCMTTGLNSEQGEAQSRESPKPSSNSVPRDGPRSYCRFRLIRDGGVGVVFGT